MMKLLPVWDNPAHPTRWDEIVAQPGAFWEGGGHDSDREGDARARSSEPDSVRIAVPFLHPLVASARAFEYLLGIMTAGRAR